MADKEESYLKTYMKEVRQKRLDTQRAQGMELRSDGVSALKSLNEKVEAPRLRGTTSGNSSADSGQHVPKANEDGKFERSDVRRGLEAQRNVAATQESGRQVRMAVSKQGSEISGAIQQLGLRLEDSIFRANNRLIKEISKLQGSMGGGRGLFGSRDLPGGNNRRNRRGPARPGGARAGGMSKPGAGLRVAGGLALGGAGGYLAASSLSRMLGASEEASEWIGAAGGLAGAAGEYILSTPGGAKKAGSMTRGAGSMLARGGSAVGPAGALALAGGGLAAYRSYKNAGVLADGDASIEDKIRAGSNLALTGVGAYLGGTVGGVKGAAIGAAAGGFTADAAEWIGEKINNVISGTKIGDAVQTAVGTTIDTVMAPFSQEARDRLSQTFDTTIESAKTVANDVAGYISGLSTKASGLYGSFTAAVGQASTSAATVIRTGVTTAEEVVAKIPSLQDVGGKAANMLSAAGTTAVGAISSGFANASSMFGSEIQNSFGPTVTAAAELIGDSVTNFRSWFSDWGTTFENLKNSLSNNFEDFKQGASIFARSTWAGLNAGAAKVKEAAVQGYNQGSGSGVGSGGSNPALPAGGTPARVVGTNGSTGDPRNSRALDTDLLSAASDAANAAQARPSLTAKAAEPGVLQRAMNAAKGVVGATTSVAGAIPNAVTTARDTAVQAGAGAGAQQMGQAIMNTVGSATKGLRSKHDFAGVSGGDMLRKYGSYTADEAQKIRDLKTSGANTSVNLKGGMPAETRDKIIAAAYASGQDPKTMLKMAAMESGGNKNAISSTGASGVFQFTGRTASGVGIKDRFDEDQNIAGGMKLAAENRRVLKDKGLPVTPENLYMMHQLGPLAAPEIIKGAMSGKSKSQLSASTQEAMNLNYGKNSVTAKDYLATNAKALDDRYNKVVGSAGDDAIIAMSAKSTVAGAPTAAKGQAAVDPAGSVVAKATAAEQKPDGLKGTATQGQLKTGLQADGPVLNKDGTRRQATAQELNPGMYKSAIQGPDAPMQSATKTSAGTVAPSKSYHVSPVAPKAGEAWAKVADAKARPTEFERIKEKPQMQQVEVANLPEPSAPGSGQVANGSHGMIPGRSPPNLDEIPMVITDMGLVLMQIGHT